MSASAEADLDERMGAVVARVAETWRGLDGQFASRNRSGRLSVALLTHAAELASLFADGVPIKGFGRALIEAGVRRDTGSVLTPSIFYDTWWRVEQRLLRRIAQQRREKV